MLSSISPLGERARQQRWAVTVSAYTAASTLADLALDDAALMPGVPEAGGRVRRFRIGPRLTEHVRHRSKYLDMPIADGHAFVFGEGGRARPRARTLKEFTSLLASLPADVVRGHLHRHDFSRWIDEVFRDGALAQKLRDIEGHREGDPAGAAAAISQAIRARYEVAPEKAGAWAKRPTR